jgi:glycosyltransferase involved in cell wall biosynthesis
MTAKTEGRRYCLITPCRDEADYGQRTLDSVLAQTVPPALWVIVDDGSTDATPELIAAAAEKVDYIRVVRREDRGKRAVGPGVIDAFYAGLDTVNLQDFDFVCKFDLDLEIPEVYFEELMMRMEAEPRLGTCSGKPYYPDPDSGELISEKCGDEMSVGMTKFYRVSCFEEIGGFVREVMWDGIDCHTCRMKGWIACSWDDEQIRFLHLRAMGSSQKSIWTGRMRHGFGQYFMGTGLVYMTVSAVYRMTRPPLILGGLAMWWGYVRSALMRKPRYNNLEFRRFLRSYQWSCLRHGKSKATAELHNRIRNA